MVKHTKKYNFNLVDGYPVTANATDAKFRLMFIQTEHKIEMRLNGIEVCDEIPHRYYRADAISDMHIQSYIDHVERFSFAPICECGKRMSRTSSTECGVQYKGGYKRSDICYECPSLSPGSHEIAENCIYAIIEEETE